jgi:hypothetical protein
LPDGTDEMFDDTMLTASSVFIVISIAWRPEANEASITFLKKTESIPLRIPITGTSKFI